MNQPLWAAIREYIDAEIKLGIARGLKGVVAFPNGDPVPSLQEQATRMETEVRRLVEIQERVAAQTQGVVSMHTMLGGH